MQLDGLGERAAIARMTAQVASARNVLGFTDDCAAIPFGDDYMVLSTDACTRDTHFPSMMTPAEIGAFAVEITLSDIAAMGAKPVGVLVAIMLPKSTDVTFLDGLRDGILARVEAADCELLGGDLKEGVALTVTTTALGIVPREKILMRRGARVGDLIAVTGTVGGAGAGLAAVNGGLPDAFLARMCTPRARLAQGHALAESGACHAAMDLSDGLAEALHAISTASDVSFVLDEDALPIDALARGGAARLGKPARALEWAVFAGGDYELVVALDADRGQETADALGLTVIGAFTQAGSPSSHPRRGFEHFRS